MADDEHLKSFFDLKLSESIPKQLGMQRTKGKALIHYLLKVEETEITAVSDLNKPATSQRILRV
jgi:hypothetical protein